MTIFGEHVDFSIEIIHDFLVDFGIENFFDGNIQAVILAFMNGAEASHWYLLANGEIVHFYLEYPIFSFIF